MSEEWIVSKAHDWRGSADNKVVCIRCGASTKIGVWNIARCTPHYEDKNSGWKDEREAGNV